MNEPTCPECGLPLSSMEHRRGLNGIHDAPTAVLVPTVEPEQEDPPSMRWNRDRLLEHAVELAIEVPEGATKAEILELINATPAPVGS